MPFEEPSERANIDVSLDVDRALARIEAKFKETKTAPTRALDGGWTLERGESQLLVYPARPSDLLLEPLPEHYVAWFPETLALEVDATPLRRRGARVSLRLIRRRAALAGAVLMDMLSVFSFGVPLFKSLAHRLEMKTLRANRRAGRQRLLRLGLEPLVPHELGGEQGPFRRSGR